MLHLASLLVTLLCSLLRFAIAEPIPAPDPALLPLLDSIVRPVLNLGASPPPTFMRAREPSPECANINQGQLQCCRGTVAGDQQVVVWLAKLYGYNLNPNDINGLNCELSVMKRHC